MGRRPLSVSQYRTFAECPWRYREVYLRKAVTVTSPFLEFGRLEHAAIQAYVKHLVAARKDAAPEDVEAVWAAFVAQHPEPIPEEMWTEAKHLLHRFASGFRLEVDSVWDTEVEMALNWDGAPVGWWDEAVWMRAKADLVQVDSFTGDVEDWKTARVPLSERALQEDLQARTYAWALWRHNPKLDPIRVHFHYVRYGIRRMAVFYGADFKVTEAWWRQVSDQLEALLPLIAG